MLVQEKERTAESGKKREFQSTNDPIHIKMLLELDSVKPCLSERNGQQIKSCS